MRNHLHHYTFCIMMASTFAPWKNDMVTVTALFVSALLVAFAEGTSEYTRASIQARIYSKSTFSSNPNAIEIRENR